MPEKVEQGGTRLEQEVEQGVEGAPSVPATSGTRKKPVPLFNPSRSTPKKPTNPYKIKVFTP